LCNIHIRIYDFAEIFHKENNRKGYITAGKEKEVNFYEKGTNRLYEKGTNRLYEKGTNRLYEKGTNRLYEKGSNRIANSCNRFFDIFAISSRIRSFITNTIFDMV
jgi:hypothetical protein